MSETILRAVGWCLAADLAAVVLLMGIVVAAARRGKQKVPLGAAFGVAVFAAACLGLIYFSVWLIAQQF